MSITSKPRILIVDDDETVRSMLTRMDATEQEVRTLRGVVATLASGKGHGRKVP